MYYLDFMAALHERLLPRTYLEIGVAEGHTLAVSRCASVGVDPELLSQFATEVRQHLVAIEQHLGAADVADMTEADLDGVFRAFHSIKALARVISGTGIEELVHEAESLLSAVRAGDRGFDAAVQQALIAAADALEDALRAPLSWPAPTSVIAELHRAAAAGDSLPAADPERRSALSGRRGVRERHGGRWP